MHIFLNPGCHLGKGREKWQKIEPEFRSRYREFKVDEILSPAILIDQVASAVKKGDRFFIAAGGDGTVNLLANALMSFPAAREEFTFGAVGLGGSNDYHKPFRPESFIRGVPIKINLKNAVLCDVIRVRFQESNKHFISQYCLINASIGIVAQANALNNSRNPLIDAIRKVSVETSIVVAALMTIFTYRNIPCTLSLDKPRQTNLTNLGVIKNPHFAGGLCYDTNIKLNDGNLGVNLCAGMNKFDAVRTMVRLYKHKFSGYPKTQSWMATKLSVSSEKTFALEIDGEHVLTKHAEFQIIPGALRCCQ
ncbi:MAG: diacylglycerol kinase family protein [Candidatus Aminicenantes bacterium]|nr:diacylglycerol kinase family protein [Candidatus Aminicenantes bacterium]